MTPRWTSPLTGSVVYEADARKVAETLPEGVDYIGPASAQAQGLETKTGAQVGLFGGAT